MTLVVNGQPREVPAGTSLAGLLDILKLTAGRLACELNAEIVPRARYADTALKDGDALEIVQMIGGG